jgi:quercetin dioxygenase-like cupin family protein
MAISHAEAGMVINLCDRTGPAANKSATLIKTPRLEIIRLVLPAGKRIPPHAVSGEVVVQCLSGKVDFEAREKRQTLEPGSLLHLEGGDLHALEALEDATVLVTILLAG